MAGARICVADDDPVLGSVLSEDLQACGYTVSVVSNGEDAITQIKQYPFDVAILDIRMPKVDGFGVLKFIKEQKPDIKVIMLTAFADLRHSVMSKEYGADDFMSKPYDFEMLRLTIERLVTK